MRGIYILVEGATEEEFVNNCLRPYLNQYGIYDVRAILMQTSSGFKGGDVSYSRYKRNVQLLLKREQDIIVTSLIDFYKLKTDFPKYNESLIILDKIKRVDFLENAISIDINDNRMVPYIQLHEFEGLLFSNHLVFDYIPNISAANLRKLRDATLEHDNPELLNDGFETAPSKRLIKLIPGYQKALHGPIMADELTVDVIKGKCVRFNSWLNNIKGKMGV